MLRINLLSGFSASDRDGGHADLSRSLRLAARLAAFHPAASKRSEAARDLWPDAAPADAANRLRVALARLKKLLPPGAILDDPGRLGFAPEVVQTDLAEAADHLSDALAEVDAGRRASALRQLLTPLSQTVLPDWSEAWLDAVRAEWELGALEALLTLAQDAADLEDWALALRAAQEALKLEPEDTQALSICAISHHHLGSHQEARAAALHLRGILARESPPAAIHPAIAAILDGTPPAKGGLGLTESQLIAAGQLIEELLATDKEAARRILGHPSLRNHVNARPAALLPLLEAATAGEDLESVEAKRCLSRAVLAASLCHQEHKSAALAQRALALDLPPVQRKAVLITHSFTCHTLGESQDAYRCIQEAEAIARDLGDMADVAAAQAQRAAFLLLDARLDEALALLAELEAPFAEYFSNTIDGAVIHANMGMALLSQGRPELAAPRYGIAEDACKRLGTSRLNALILLQHGVALMELGQVKPGAAKTIAGLAEAYNRGSAESFASSMLWAGRALLVAGAPSAAVGALDWMKAAKEGLGLHLNGLEQHLSRQWKAQAACEPLALPPRRAEAAKVVVKTMKSAVGVLRNR